WMMPMSPVMWSMAVRIALPLPMLWGWTTTLMRGSSAASLWRISTESSFDPSSTATSSISRSTGESSTLPTMVRRVRDSLYTCIKTESFRTGTVYRMHEIGAGTASEEQPPPDRCPQCDQSERCHVCPTPHRLRFRHRSGHRQEDPGEACDGNQSICRDAEEQQSNVPCRPRPSPEPRQPCDRQRRFDEAPPIGHHHGQAAHPPAQLQRHLADIHGRRIEGCDQLAIVLEDLRADATHDVCDQGEAGIGQQVEGEEVAAAEIGGGDLPSRREEEDQSDHPATRGPHHPCGITDRQAEPDRQRP